MGCRHFAIIQYTSILSALFERKKGWTWFVKTNNPAPITLWKIFPRFFWKPAAAALWKRALSLKFRLNMEKQRFKSCLNLCKLRFHLWSYLRILRTKNCRTPWDDWLFCHFIYSVRQSWWRLADSNRRPSACEADALTSWASPPSDLFMIAHLRRYFKRNFCFSRKKFPENWKNIVDKNPFIW